MEMPPFKPLPLLKLERNNIVDNLFYGFISHYNCAGLIKSIGASCDYPFFLRSLAKPLQASLMCDFKTDTFFNFSDAEIAIFLASHAAQNYHIELVRSALEKIGLNETALKCGVHQPFVALNDNKNSEIHNNCSGKHTLMLALCVQNNWDIENYLDFNHPLQKLIFKKIVELSGFKKRIDSLDGCGAPIYALPFANISKAFFSLFSNQKYKRIETSFLKYPEIIGGENSVDTKIMQNGSGNLIAKVGAGGFLFVLNLKKREILLIKLCQDNNLQREVIASIALNQLGWLNETLCETVVKNVHECVVGEFVSLFEF